MSIPISPTTNVCHVAHQNVSKSPWTKTRTKVQNQYYVNHERRIHDHSLCKIVCVLTVINFLIFLFFGCYQSMYNHNQETNNNSTINALVRQSMNVHDGLSKITPHPSPQHTPRPSILSTTNTNTIIKPKTYEIKLTKQIEMSAIVIHQFNIQLHYEQL